MGFLQSWIRRLLTILFVAAIMVSLGLVRSAKAAAPLGGPSHITCYNDDSLDAINQNLLASSWLKPAASVAEPEDCKDNPSVTVNKDGEVFLKGKKIFGSAANSALDVRVSPTSAVTILTRDARIFTYINSQLTEWLQGTGLRIGDFRMSRTGSVIARSEDGSLIINGKIKMQGSGAHVVQMLASACGQVVALMSNGAVVSEKGIVFHSAADNAKTIKVAANGTIVWLTETGKLGSTSTATIYSDGSDPVQVFKVNPKGRVAYVTHDGKLGRDGVALSTFGERVEDFRILSDGSVTAIDASGKAHTFN